MSPQSKYYALRELLRQQPDAVPLELSFVEIEAILGRPLPATAQVTRAGWGNSQTAQGRGWQEVGWLVDDVNFAAKLVVFRPARITYRVTPIRKSKGWSGEQIKSLREFAAENIFGPLGMTSTHFNDNHAEIVPQSATGYAPPWLTVFRPLY